jgi:hypothetical protein
MSCCQSKEGIVARNDLHTRVNTTDLLTGAFLPQKGGLADFAAYSSQILYSTAP